MQITPLRNDALPNDAKANQASPVAESVKGSSSKGAGEAASSTPKTTGQDSSDPSVENPALAKLQALIRALQRQLGELERQTANAGRHAGKDPQAISELQTLSGEVASVSAALQTAFGELMQVMQASGTSKGALVSTTA
jgi:hypothetical protein